MSDTGRQSAGNVALAWAAGFVDGEGCLTLSRQRTRKRWTNYQPHLHITNTHYESLILVSGIFRDHQIGHHVMRKHMTKKNPQWRDAWVLQIGGMKRILRFLDVMQPYLVTKAEQARILRAFIEHRMSIPIHQPHGPIEDEYAQQMSQANHGSSQTARAASGWYVSIPGVHIWTTRSGYTLSRAQRESDRMKIQSGLQGDLGNKPDSAPLP